MDDDRMLEIATLLDSKGIYTSIPKEIRNYVLMVQGMRSRIAMDACLVSRFRKILEYALHVFTESGK